MSWRSWLQQRRQSSPSTARTGAKSSQVGSRGISRRSVELWVALYGAIVGTVAVGWQIYQQASQRPDLHIGGAGTSFSELHFGSKGLVMEIKLPLANLGAKPAIVYTVHPDMLDVAPDGSSNASSFPLLEVHHPDIEEELPLSVPANDLKILTITAGFECECDHIPANSSYRGMLHVVANTSAGDLDWWAGTLIMTSTVVKLDKPTLRSGKDSATK